MNDTSTLEDHAYSQDGSPIPEGKRVRITLLDPTGNHVETRWVYNDDDWESVVHYVGEYCACMAAEGMAGSVRWEQVDEDDNAPV